MPEDSKAHIPESLMFIWVILRVVIFLAIWLAIFLAMFLGYFTIPIIMVGVLAIIYAFADIGVYITMNRQRRIAGLPAKLEGTKDAGENEKDF